MRLPAQLYRAVQTRREDGEKSRGALQRRRGRVDDRQAGHAAHHAAHVVGVGLEGQALERDRLRPGRGLKSEDQINPQTDHMKAWWRTLWHMLR